MLDGWARRKRTPRECADRDRSSRTSVAWLSPAVGGYRRFWHTAPRSPEVTVQADFPPAGAAPGDHRRNCGPARGPRRGSDPGNPSRRRVAWCAIRTRCTADDAEQGRAHAGASDAASRCADRSLNFRGVGGSAGHYDAGVGELEDALAACAGRERNWRCEVLWLAGFSFGAAWRSRPRPLRSPLHSSRWRRPSVGSSWRRSRVRPARGSWCRRP